jgi:hypothetical protein
MFIVGAGVAWLEKDGAGDTGAGASARKEGWAAELEL